MKKSWLCFFLPLAVSAMLTGCSNADELNIGYAHSKNGRVVRLAVTTQGAGSRAADGQYTASTGFNGGEKMKVFMKASSSVQNSDYVVGNPVNGRSALTVDNGSEALLYPITGSAKIYALYPSTSTTSHVVRHDQRSTDDGNGGYRQSDLMFASAITVSQDDMTEEQSMAFQHQLVKFKLEIHKSANVSQVQSVTLGNVKRKCSVTVSDTGITLGESTAAVSGDADYSADQTKNNSILMGAEEASSTNDETYTYVCLLPAQNWSDSNPGKLTVKADGKEHVYDITRSVTGGQVATFPLWEYKEPSEEALTKDAAVSKRNEIIENWKSNSYIDYITSGFLFGFEDYEFGNLPNLSMNSLTYGDYTMRFSVTKFGNWDSDDSNPSIWISLHGGGGTTTANNDSQWYNQMTLYQPSGKNLYICPRGITDTWNLHFLDEDDWFYKELIKMCVALYGADPDRVYLIGYSAGGDGVWRLGPRMADTWAAATMCAGHPGDVSLLNLRNTPFGIWCGSKDTAYKRNEECQLRINEMADLHSADPGGYICDGHIVEGKPHWMDGAEKAAVPWMNQFTRDPYPDKVVWLQGQKNKPLRTHFYWISVPENELDTSVDKTVVAGYDKEKNTVTVTQCDYSMLTFYFNDDMVDLDKPVKVIYNSKTVFYGRVYRLSSTLEETMQREDPSYVFPAKLTVTINNN